MTRSAVARVAREVLLTSGALLGVLCLVLTVAGSVAGVKPLMYRSGSMAPTIQTGDLSLSRAVPAADLTVGDVVSVVTSSGSRVTHRIVDIESASADQRRLTLQGDANDTPDEEVYEVAEVQRVLFTAPKAGYVVSAASSPVGVFVLGLYVAAMLSIVLRRGGGGGASPSPAGDGALPRGGARRAPRPRRRSLARAATAALTAAAVLASTPAGAAAWIDSVTVSGTTFTAGTMTNPPRTPTCTLQGGGETSARIAWTAPTAGGSGVYRVEVLNGGQTELDREVSGLSTNITYDDLQPPPQTATLAVRISTKFAAESNWTSAAVTTTVKTRARYFLFIFIIGYEAYC